MRFHPPLPVRFHPPLPARFSEALAFIEAVTSSNGCTLIALDQPTIVPNLTSLRPVERTALDLVSCLGGVVQPSNRGEVGMFCDASPIWPLLAALGTRAQPEECRTATAGLFLVEVFPAPALVPIEPSFFGRLAAPRYNLARRKTFKLDDWKRVVTAAAASFTALGFPDAAAPGVVSRRA